MKRSRKIKRRRIQIVKEQLRDTLTSYNKMHCSKVSVGVSLILLSMVMILGSAITAVEVGSTCNFLPMYCIINQCFNGSEYNYCWYSAYSSETSDICIEVAVCDIPNNTTRYHCLDCPICADLDVKCVIPEDAETSASATCQICDHTVDYIMLAIFICSILTTLLGMYICIFGEMSSSQYEAIDD
jgi:hypothetical protein